MGKNKLIDDLTPKHPMSGINPEMKFLDNDESMDFALNLLHEESPRIVERVIQDLENQIHKLRTVKAGIAQVQIRFSDLLILSYVAVKHSYLIDFFKKTIHELLPPVGNQELERMYSRLDRGNEEKKEDIIDLIADTTKHRFSSEKEKVRARRLVGAVAFLYFDRLRGNYDDKNKLQYEGSSSYPENLNDYLNIIPGYTTNTFTQAHQIFRIHQENKKLPSDIQVKDLYEYSRFLRHYAKGDADTRLNIDVARKILKYIVTGKISPSYRSFQDSDLQSTIYEFCFQLLEAFEGKKRKDKIIVGEIIEIFKEALYSKSLPVGAKYQILNVIANNRRGAGSDIHRRMDSLFEEMLLINKEKTVESIKQVIDEAHKKYFDGNEILYENEENYLYVLYQTWSGKKDASGEIKKIRRAATRGLEQYPDVIEQYWSHFPEAETPVDRWDFHFLGKNSELYMPLKKLVEISQKRKQKVKKNTNLLQKIEYWTKVVGNPSDYKSFTDRVAVKDDSSTLFSILKARGLV